MSELHIFKLLLGNRTQIKQGDGGKSGESGKNQPGDHCDSARDR